MNVIRFDVVVIGAGPSGVAAAIDLAKNGASVALVEKETFPRQKPCAGGVSISALQLLKYDIATVTREQVKAIQLSRSGKDKVVMSAGQTLIAMTRRSELDACGLQAALAAGCQLITANNILGVDQDDESVTVRYADMKIRASYLVAADGAGSAVRRLVSGEKPKIQAIAVEANIDANDVRIMPDVRTRVDFGMVKGGYAWVFPKGDHYNVGLYTHDSRLAAHINKKHLKEYARAILGTDKLADIQGFPIATACSRQRMASGRVLFVGDAGGFSDAISGEGIYGAILTGQLAAAAILRSDDPARHYQESAAPYLRRCTTTRTLSWPFYRFLPLSYPVFSRRLASLAKGLDHPG